MNGHIRLTGLGKAYKLYPRKRHKWIEVLTLGRSRQHRSHEVLNRLDIEILPGQAVSIVGHNGAGKSTLLKLIVGVTRPTEGQVEVAGRVAAILELGIGFHHDLTGRDNIPLAAQLIGLDAAEIEACTQAMIDFAELGELIDAPIRTYSSGMLARLAFSIATAVRPDILIVDEVLSVGDAYFQHKSFSRIREFKASGTTVLFVSHDFGAVRSLCERVLLLSEGRLLRDGAPADVLDYYNALIADSEKGAGIRLSGGANGVGIAVSSGTGEAEFEEVELLDGAGLATRKVATGANARVRLKARTRVALDSVAAGIIIRDRAGNPVFGTNTWHLRQPLLRLPADCRFEIDFRIELNLGPGSYNLSVALVDRDTHLSRNFAWQDNVLVFEVVNMDRPEFVGTVFLPAHAGVLRDYPAWDLNRHRSRVHSQFGEDGILRRIFEIVGAQNRFCVEFGGYDGITMSNTARLIREEGWSGRFIEADPEQFARLASNYRDTPSVRAVQAMVRADNIEALLDELGAPRDIDLLCIDIDGNDYWVWRAIERFRPRVVAIEFNGAYPPPRKWVMAYNPGHRWAEDDYYGASAQSLCDLGKAKGYELVCCEEEGANLFFVDAALYPLFAIPDNSIARLFRPPRYGRPEFGWNHPHREGPNVEV